MTLPKEKHWAIITTRTIYHEGDERSRTNPGHGYPAYSEETINYEVFTDYEKFVVKVEQLTLRNEKFTAAAVKPLKVSTTVQVEIN